ncbi:GNAT family N-acetyltransferase [Uliginosibacterium aquaticum]|uniref:EVE domain-containing protein n=1 Tax=Uliginosibacterium aquaticum TaxID=2731212 RepID=A0ABX2IAY6_9RHOO|nr:GNAT family N-acetyltransferase [Uliginosibacterium aquaticum]NSL53539.1 EVE domain-containing protein [Uliginosibacterium aquaticum]
MDVNENSVRVLTEQKDVAAFISDVICAADSDKKALGFFSRSVYPEYCRHGKLFVATVRINGDERYAGHLLFDVRFPKAHVRQIFVSEPYRGKKVGIALLNTLKSALTDAQFISIHARVAEDLKAANAFWEAHGFYAQRVEPGGASRNRTIVVRAHELNTPQLFSSSGISAADPLGLDIAEGTAKPLYLLDLNVLFDLGPRRPRHELAMNVFRAQRMQACSLAISTEIDTELNRTARDGKTDPMLSFAATFAKFATPPESEWQRLFPALAEIIFPERHASDSLTKNDSSDLKHLATAIYHRLPGIITSDGRILDRATDLRKLFGLDVISPELFQVDPESATETAIHRSHAKNIIEVHSASPSDTPEIHEMLRELGIDVATQVNEWASTEAQSTACFRQIARCNGKIAGYLVWPVNIRSFDIRAHVAIAEDQPGAHEVAQALLSNITGTIRSGDVGHIRLRCPPRQVVLREVAGLFGYMASSTTPTDLQKIVFKKRLTPKNWDHSREFLKNACKISLPEQPPIFRHIDQQISVTRADGQRVLVPIFRLETLLAPMIFGLAGREGVMVPIRKQFEEHLLSESPQASLLPSSKAHLSQQRHYLSDKKTLKNFNRGDMMFFYEPAKNGGVGAVIALGRVLRAYLREEAAMQADDLAPSVLNSNQLSAIGKSKTKTITVFDNILRLPRPVSMFDLKAMGCGNPHQLITTQRLSADQVQKILEKGLG